MIRFTRFLTSLFFLQMTAQVVSPKALASVAPMASVDANCVQNPNDPFDHGWRIAPDAPHVPNQCLDSSVVRPIEILNRAQGAWQIANFFHAGHYWTARLVENDVDHVAMMSKRIARDVELVNVIHIQTRFYFHHGLQLFDSLTGAAGPLLKSAVVSWEPAFPAGPGYEHVTTFFRNYPIVGRFISVDEPMAGQISGALPAETASVQEFKLALDAAQAWLLLQNHLQLSQERQMGLAYILLRRNCATSFFDILDATLAQSAWPHSGTRFRTGLSLDPIFGPALAALRERHLIATDR